MKESKFESEDELILKVKKKERERKKARIEWANRKEQLTKEEINKNFNEYVNIILTPNANNVFEIDLDFGDLKHEMNVMTEYIDLVLQMIKPIPVDCKYYFIEIQDYRKCFVAIRKIFVRNRKDYNDAEEKVIDLLENKYALIRPGFKKKIFRPEARNIFYFLDRRIPMDLVMFKVIELNEAMRNDKAKADPIQQTKNSDMLKFTSGMRHQCTLVRNLMFSYLLTVSRIKVIFKSFNNFSNEFSDFDKRNKDFYNRAKEVVGNHEFNEAQGIKVVDVNELEQNNDKENKQADGDDTLRSGQGDEGKDSEKDGDGSSQEEDKSEESESTASSMESNSIEEKFIPPENIGRGKSNGRGNERREELQSNQGSAGGLRGQGAQEKQQCKQRRRERRQFQHVHSETSGRGGVEEVGGSRASKGQSKSTGAKPSRGQGAAEGDSESDYTEEFGRKGGEECRSKVQKRRRK